MGSEIYQLLLWITSIVLEYMLFYIEKGHFSDPFRPLPTPLRHPQVSENCALFMPQLPFCQNNIGRFFLETGVENL